MAMEGFKLGVEVLLAVFAVSERVETDLVLIVWIDVSQRHCVPSNVHMWLLKGNLLSLELILAWELLFVDLQLCDCHRLQVEEELSIIWGCFQIEVDYRVAEIVISLIQCKLEIIFDLLHQLFSLLSLFLRQGLSRLELFIDNRLAAEML